MRKRTKKAGSGGLKLTAEEKAGMRERVQKEIEDIRTLRSYEEDQQREQRESLLGAEALRRALARIAREDRAAAGAR